MGHVPGNRTVRIYAEPCLVRRMYEVKKFITTKPLCGARELRTGYRSLRRSGMDQQAARWCLIALWCAEWQYTSPSVQP